MSEFQPRFTYSPEEEAAVARALGGISDRPGKVLQRHQRVSYTEVDPQEALRTTGRLDLGAKGALKSFASGKSSVHKK